MRAIQLIVLFASFATSTFAAVTTREDANGEPIEVVGLADPTGCHPFDFAGTVVERAYAKDAVMLTGIVVEAADGSKQFINVSVPDDLDIALRGNVYHGLEVLTRTGRRVTGKAFACGAAGRVQHLDAIR